MLCGYSARSTKNKSYSTRITKYHQLITFITQKVLNEED